MTGQVVVTVVGRAKIVVWKAIWPGHWVIGQPIDPIGYWCRLLVHLQQIAKHQVRLVSSGGNACAYQRVGRAAKGEQTRIAAGNAMIPFELGTS